MIAHNVEIGKWLNMSKRIKDHARIVFKKNQLGLNYTVLRSDWNTLNQGLEIDLEEVTKYLLNSQIPVCVLDSHGDLYQRNFKVEDNNQITYII
jgi:hypothetical protein